METKTLTRKIDSIGLPGLAVACVLILSLIRLWLASKAELIPEEAYYWTYSQHPALSYFDHPPMVAWMVALGTAVFGNTELGVRFAAIVLWPASAWLLFSVGRLWFDRKVGVLAVLLFCLCPVFVGIGFVVTPDFALVFFWLLTLYAISKVLHGGANVYWILAGIGFGCAMLSKYTAVMLAASLFLFLLLSTNYRHWLLRYQPWLALIVGMVVFSPVIIWNAQNHWASFLFQSTRTEVGSFDPPRVEFGTFWMYQLGALTPLLFALFAYTLSPATRRGWIEREDRWNFSMSFALPLFIIFVLASFKTKGHINWTAPTYLSWTLAAAAVILQIDEVWRITRPMAWRWLVGLTVGLCLIANVLVHTSLVWGIPQSFAFKSAGGWQGLADKVSQATAELTHETGQAAFILGADKYNLAAEMGFYVRDPVDIINDYALETSGLGYRFWFDLKQFEGRPAIAIFEQDKFSPYSPYLLQRHFARIGQPVPVEIQGKAGQKRMVYLVKCYGYSVRQ